MGAKNSSSVKDKKSAGGDAMLAGTSSLLELMFAFNETTH